MELNNCNRTTAAMINIDDDGENIKAGAGSGQKSSLSSGRRERRSRESHSKSLTSTSSSHVRSRGRSQPKRSQQSSSALVDEDGVVCPISPSTTPKFHRRNSLPTLSTCESSSVSTTSRVVVGSLNQDPKYKVCPPNNVMQRQLNESINVSTNMDINDKSDLGSSELTVLISNCQGKRVTRSSGKDKNGKDDTSYGADGGWKIEEEIKYTRRSPFEDKDEEEEEEEEAASDCKEEEENEMNDFLSKEGKGIMLCMPVTEVQQQLEPPTHDHDKPIGQEEQEDEELEICARRLRRYRSREQTTNQSSRSRSLDIINDRRPDPEGFSCKDYSRQASSTQHQHNGKLSVKKTSRPTAHRQKEPEEKDHTQRRPRRSRRSSDTKHIARSSSFTYGGNGHQVPPPPPPLKSEQHSTTSPPKRHNSAPDFQQLLESVATQKSKVSNDRVNKAVNPRQDDDTLSTAASSTVPQSPIKDSQILRHPQLPDVKESPPSMTTDGNVISSYLPCEEVNLNNYDKRGFCVVHPHIRLRKKKFFKRLSLSLQLNCMDPNGIGVVWNGSGSSSDEYNDREEDGWKIITSVCPECCTEELRRTQLALAALLLCQSVETNSVTEHQQQATASLDRVCTLDMLSRLPTTKSG